MNDAILRVTDGTSTIDLIRGVWRLFRWQPSIVQPKGGGTWRSSPLSEGRRLVNRQFGNAIETFELKAKRSGADNLISELQDLQRLLEKAVEYWTTSWQNEPVWIEARARCETNTRYALLYNWQIPELRNWYAQPFAMTPRILDDVTLILERGHWTENNPLSTGTCVEISGKQTVQAGIYEPSASTDDAYVDNVAASINTGGNQIYFGTSAAGNGLSAGVRFLNVDIPQGATIVRAFIRFQPGAGNGVTCNATLIGENTDTAAAFSTYLNFINRPRTTASIAWNNIETFVVSGFEYDTPDVTVILQEIVNRPGWQRCNDLVVFVENNASPTGGNRGAYSWDFSAHNDGAQLFVEWSVDWGRDETCLEEVYWTNKQNYAALTHILIDNGGVIGSNLLDISVPYRLLPLVPAVNDAVYFGIDTGSGGDNIGVFNSLVFDLSRVQTDLTIVWEYYNGAWVTLNTKDNTDTDGYLVGDPFDTLGVKSVSFEQESNWTTVAVGGVTGYWVRARVTAIGAAPVAPIQQNRHPYTITWPYIEVASDQIEGDIAAIARLLTKNRSENASGVPGPIVQASIEDLVIGLRSLSRGTSFNAYLNASDRQLPYVTQIDISGSSSFATDVTTPTGRHVTRAVNADFTEEFITWRIGQRAAADYYGEYRGFFRGRRTGGDTDDVRIRLIVRFVSRSFWDEIEYDTFVTPYAINATMTGFGIPADFGKVVVAPPSGVFDSDDDTYELQFIIELDSTGNATTFNASDLILIPADEWFVYCEALATNTVGQALGEFRGAQVTSLIEKKEVIAELLELQHNTKIAPFLARSNGKMILQRNAAQRLWFFGANVGYIPTSCTAQLWKNQRYLSARGDR